MPLPLLGNSGTRRKSGVSSVRFPCTKSKFPQNVFGLPGTFCRNLLFVQGTRTLDTPQSESPDTHLSPPLSWHQLLHRLAASAAQIACTCLFGPMNEVSIPTYHKPLISQLEVVGPLAWTDLGACNAGLQLQQGTGHSLSTPVHSLLAPGHSFPALECSLQHQ